MIRKIGFGNQAKRGKGLKRAWTSMFPKSNAKKIEIVYDCYLKNPIKVSRRIQATEVAIKTMNLNLDSSVPLKVKKFWHHQPKNKISNCFVNLILLQKQKKRKNIYY